MHGDIVEIGYAGQDRYFCLCGTKLKKENNIEEIKATVWPL